MSITSIKSKYYKTGIIIYMILNGIMWLEIIIANIQAYIYGILLEIYSKQRKRMNRRTRNIAVATILSVGFTIIQYIEYKGGRTNISMRSTFHATTGLHGIHTIIGEIILMVGMIREGISGTIKKGAWTRIGNINLNFLDGRYIIIVIIEYA